MESKFLQINSLKKEIDDLLPSPKWSSDFLEKIKIDFTFHSNKIENNSFTYGQTISFLKNAIAPKNVSLRDCLDIQNHYDILDVIFKNQKQELSSHIIVDLHASLMKDKRQWNYPDDYSPGKFKWDTNYTIRRDGTIHYFMNADKVQYAINDLVSDVNNQLRHVDINNPNKHPLSIATYFHNRFIGEIHPFADGNGRVGRILLNNILIKNDFAPLFINETEKMKYFVCFETSSSKDLGTMLPFFADQLIESLKQKKEFLLNGNLGID